MFIWSKQMTGLLSIRKQVGSGKLITLVLTAMLLLTACNSELSEQANKSGEVAQVNQEDTSGVEHGEGLDAFPGGVVPTGTDERQKTIPEKN